MKIAMLFPMYAESIETKTRRILEQYTNNNDVNGGVVELGQMVIHHQLRAGSKSTEHVLTGGLQFT